MVYSINGKLSPGRLTRILSHWRKRTDADIKFSNVFVPPIMARDVIEDAFRPIGRDGASLIEVQIRLQKSLVSLAQIAPESLALAAGRMSHEALERARTSNLLASEVAEIKFIAQPISKTASPKTNDPSREI